MITELLFQKLVHGEKSAVRTAADKVYALIFGNDGITVAAEFFFIDGNTGRLQQSGIAQRDILCIGRVRKPRIRRRLYRDAGSDFAQKGAKFLYRDVNIGPTGFGIDDLVIGRAVFDQIIRRFIHVVFISFPIAFRSTGRKGQTSHKARQRTQKREKFFYCFFHLFFPDFFHDFLHLFLP